MKIFKLGTLWGCGGPWRLAGKVLSSNKVYFFWTKYNFPNSHFLFLLYPPTRNNLSWEKSEEINFLLIDGFQQTTWTSLLMTDLSTWRHSRSSSSSSLEQIQNRLKFQWLLPSHSGDNQPENKNEQQHPLYLCYHKNNTQNHPWWGSQLQQ